jgi:hypothetical protein
MLMRYMAVCLGRAGTSAAELRTRLVHPDGLRFGELHDKVVVLRVPKHQWQQFRYCCDRA